MVPAIDEMTTMLNTNLNNDDGDDSSRSDVRDAEPSASSPKMEEGGGGGGAAGGGGGATGGGGGGKKGGFGLDKIIAIVAFVFAIIALALTIMLHLLWWYWPWCVTAPALTLALAAVIISFVAPSHKDATLTCAIIGIIFSIGVIAWCAVDLSACHSYQGPYHTRTWKPKFVPITLPSVEDIAKPKDPEYEMKSDLKSYLLEREGMEKQYFYYQKGLFCQGRCFDWAHKKKLMMKMHSCDEKVEKWFEEKLLNSSSRSCHWNNQGVIKSPVAGNLKVLSPVAGVDTYSASPIYLTHQDAQDKKKWRYSEEEENKLKKQEKNFCEKFEVDKFIEKRDKCEEEMEKKFSPKCQTEELTWEETKLSYKEKPHKKVKTGKKVKTVKTGFFYEENVRRKDLKAIEDCWVEIDKGEDQGEYTKKINKDKKKAYDEQIKSKEEDLSKAKDDQKESIQLSIASREKEFLEGEEKKRRMFQMTWPYQFVESFLTPKDPKYYPRMDAAIERFTSQIYQVKKIPDHGKCYKTKKKLKSQEKEIEALWEKDPRGNPFERGYEKKYDPTADEYVGKDKAKEAFKEFKKGYEARGNPWKAVIDFPGIHSEETLSSPVERPSGTDHNTPDNGGDADNGDNADNADDDNDADNAADNTGVPAPDADDADADDADDAAKGGDA